MIDTHTHLNFLAFESDWREVVEKAKESGVTKMIIVGTDLESSKKAISMTKEVDDLYAAVGIHPHHVKQFTLANYQLSIESQLNELEGLIDNPKVVGIGEIGLDYHVYVDSKKYEHVSISEELIKMQKLLFKKQVNLAVKYKKPIIVHSREAKDEVLNELLTIRSGLSEKIAGVFHCFEGSKKYAKKILEAGYFISFTGNITYDLGRAETSKTIPLSKLLLETDCPYMTPSPIRNEFYERPHTNASIVRGKEKPLRCEPGDVKITAKYHAKLRDTTFEEVVKATTSNANTLFGI